MVIKTIVISKNLNGASDFTTSFLNIPFTPDYFIIKQITYAHDNSETGIGIIYSNDLGQSIGSIYDSCSVSPNSYFSLPSRGLTDWSFKIIQPDGSAFSSGGMLSLTLEFGTNK